MNKVNLWGYTIYENGKVLEPQGKEVKKGRQIRIKSNVDKKARLISYARFVYYAFNYKTFDFNDKTIVIKFINGDKNDFSISNLSIIKRKYVIQGQYNISAKLIDKQVNEIKELYGRKNNFDDTKNNPITNISYRKLAEKYGVSHTTIAGIIKGKFRNSKNYIMK